MSTARSGRSLGEISLDAVLAGELGIDDVSIHPDTLRSQAIVAERHGNPHLANNLRRAAELSMLSDERVLAIYEALRPGRSTAAELVAIAEELEAASAPKTADLVREAAAAYARRGIAR